MISRKIMSSVLILFIFGLGKFFPCQSSFQKEILDSREVIFRKKINLEKENDLKDESLDHDYHQGLLKEKEHYEQAKELLLESAKSVNPKAQLMAGVLYLYPQKSSETNNTKSAFELFDDASEEDWTSYKGEYLVYYALSVCFQEGYGTKKDLNKSDKYWKKGESLEKQEKQIGN